VNVAVSLGVLTGLSAHETVAMLDQAAKAWEVMGYDDSNIQRASSILHHVAQFKFSAIH
jgi:hypothetical protein